MATLSINFEIKESNKTDGVLTDDFKNNSMATFGKLLMDYLMEGNEIRLSKASTQETVETIEVDGIVIDDETGEETTVKQKKETEVYNITVNIQVEKVIVNGHKKCVKRKNPIISVSDGKISTTFDSGKTETLNAGI